MADQKISELTALVGSSVDGANDLLAIVDDSESETKKILLNELDNFLKDTTVTQTNKTLALGSNTISGTAAQFNTAVTDDTFAYISDNLSVFAATTSAQLLGVISDETGTGLLVFNDTPTIITPTVASFVNATHDHLAAAGGGTITEASISDLQSYLLNIVEDTTPQLGGSLDANGFDLKLDPGDHISFDAAETQQIIGGTDGLLINLPTGDDWVFRINLGEVAKLSATVFDLNGQDIDLNSGAAITFDSSTQAQKIGGDSGGLTYTIPTGDTHDFVINAVSEFLINATTADFQGNTLTDILDITSITSLNGVVIGNYILSTDKLDALSATTSAELATVISDETGSGLLVFNDTPTIITPTIASLTNATHDHSNAAGGANLTNTALTSGTFSSITGIGTQTQALNMNSNLINNVTDPSSAQDAATKNYVDSIAINGVVWKESARVATTANVTLSGEQIIDGVTTTTDRILVKDQTAGEENGVYVTAAGAWARGTDTDTAAEILQMAVFIQEGTANADQGFVLTTNAPITLDTTSLVFTQFTGLGQITAGAGLTKTGNTIDVIGTASRITVNANDIDIASDYVGQTSITTLGTIATGTWEATAVASAFLDADTAHLTTNQTFSGVKTFSADIQASEDIELTTGKILAFDSTTQAQKIVGDAGGLTSTVPNADTHDFIVDATTVQVIAETGVTVTGTLDVSGILDTLDIETATVSARDGSLAITIADSTGVSTFVSGAVLVAPVLGTPASGALTNCTAYPGDSSLVTTGTITSGTWQGTVVASAFLDADTAHLTTTQAFSGRKTFNNRVIYDQGADVASGTELTLGDDGNAFDVTGTTTINTILATNWTLGAQIVLRFDGILTVTNNSGGTNDILLGDGGNMTTAAGDILGLIFDGTDWREMFRSVVGGGGISNIVEDTTPQLGGDLDGNAFDILLDTGDHISFDAAEAQKISGDAGGINLDVPTGDAFDIRINGALEFGFGATLLDMNNNALIMGTGIIELSAGSQSIIGSATGIDFNTATGDTHDFRINNNSIFEVAATTITFADNLDVVLNTTTGTIWGTGVTEKQAWWGATAVVQPGHIADPTGGSVIDVEARAQLVLLLADMAELGFQAAS